MARKYFGKCDVVGCDKPAKAGTYCHMHYARMRRHNRLDRDEPINKGKACSIEGCDTPAKVRGMCGMHAMRKERWGNPFLGAKQPKTNPCIVRGCNEVEKCKGLCNRHYTNYTYHQEKNGEEYSILQYARERSTVASGNTMYTITCDIFPKFIKAADRASGEDTLEFNITYQSPYTGETKTRTGIAMSKYQGGKPFYAEVLTALKDYSTMTTLATTVMEQFLKLDWDELNMEDPTVQAILDYIRTNTFRYDINVVGPASQNEV